VLATTRLPDLVVLDMMMPKATGLEVTRSMREQAATKDIRVILLTARAQEVDIAGGFEAGADEAEIYDMRADGKNVRRLTRTPKYVDDTQPRYSPDGGYIIFTSNRVAFWGAQPSLPPLLA
jgi:CheY-like chemotaxis protein